MSQFRWEFAKDAYVWELDRKDRVHNSLSFPTGIVVLMATVAALFAGTAPSLPDSFLGYVLFGAGCVLFGSIAFTVYFLARSYWGYEYCYVVSPVELRQYAESLKSYYESTGEADSADLIESDLRSSTLDQRETCAERNFESNQQKLGYLHKAKGAIVVGLCALLVGTAPFFVLKNRDNVQRVHITNFEEAAAHGQDQ